MRITITKLVRNRQLLNKIHKYIYKIWDYVSFINYSTNIDLTKSYKKQFSIIEIFNIEKNIVLVEKFLVKVKNKKGHVKSFDEYLYDYYFSKSCKSDKLPYKSSSIHLLMFHVHFI